MVVEVGVILAARGMYDAEVGSSGGRCESGPWVDVVEERVGVSRRTLSVPGFAMYGNSKYEIETN